MSGIARNTSRFASNGDVRITQDATAAGVEQTCAGIEGKTERKYACTLLKRKSVLGRLRQWLNPEQPFIRSRLLMRRDPESFMHVCFPHHRLLIFHFWAKFQRNIIAGDLDSPTTELFDFNTLEYGRTSRRWRTNLAENINKYKKKVVNGLAQAYWRKISPCFNPNGLPSCVLRLPRVIDRTRRPVILQVSYWLADCQALFRLSFSLVLDIRERIFLLW